MTNGGGGNGNHCVIRHLTLGMREPRVMAIAVEKNKGEEEKKVLFCMSLGGFQEALGVRDVRSLIPSVVPGLCKVNEGYHLDVDKFCSAEGDHVQRLLSKLPKHLHRHLPIIHPQTEAQKPRNGLHVVQA